MSSIPLRRLTLTVAVTTALGSLGAVAPAIANSPSYPVVCSTAQVDAPRNQVTTFALSCADGDGNPVDEYVVLTQPAKAQSFSVDTATGEVSYEPDAGANGTDVFTFKGVVVGLGESASTQAVITLGNQRPVCDPVEVVQAVHDRAVAVPLKCTDADGDALSLTTGTMGASHGTVATGDEIVYTPAAGFVGTDSFTVRATDGDLLSDEVAVEVAVGNTRPTCVGRDLRTVHDRAKSFTVSCSDLDGDSLTRSVVAKAQHGTVTVSSSGFVYKPAARYVGSDTFTVAVTDGIQASVPVRVNVKVTNAIPTCTGGGLLVTRGRTRVLAKVTCSDPDRDAVRVVVVDAPEHGRLVRRDRGLFYVANRGYFGRDSFKLAGSDGVARSKAVSFVVRVKRG